MSPGLQLPGGAPNPGRWHQRLPLLALMTGLAVLLNQLPLPLFYGIQVLLGSVPPILALLLWRSWWAVAMGAVASLQTWRLWGHPWAVLIFTLEMVWLTLAVRRSGAESGEEGSGRVVLASIAYWLLLGSPLVLLFYGLVLGIDPANVVVTAVKQSFNGVFNTGLAFAALIAIRGLQARRGEGPGLSLRGVIVVLALLAITVPTLVLSIAAGHQLERAAQQGALDGLKTVNLVVARSGADDNTVQLLKQQLGTSLAYRRMGAGSAVVSSDPALFQRLDAQFVDGGRSYVHPDELAILIPRARAPLLRKWINGYWSYSQQYGTAAGTYVVQVVEPSREVVVRMQRQSSILLGTTLAVMVLGAGVSIWVGERFQREFQTVLGPDNDGQQLPQLRLSAVSELRSLAKAINWRIQQVNQLGLALEQANANLERSQAELEQLASCDLLTGCGNRQALQQQLQLDWQQCREAYLPLSCLYIDVDGFTDINEQHGQQAGDTLLRGLARAARKQLREGERLYRPGDDEFVVLAPGRSPQAARQLARQLQAAMAAVYIESAADGSAATGAGGEARRGESSSSASSSGEDSSGTTGAGATGVGETVTGTGETSGRPAAAVVASSVSIGISSLEGGWGSGRQLPGRRPGAEGLLSQAEEALQRARRRGQGQLELWVWS